MNFYFSFSMQGVLLQDSQGDFWGGGKFLDDLNSTFGSGVLTCDFEGHEFKAFMKWLMKNYLW